VRQAEQRVQVVQFDLGARLLPGFAQRAGFRGFAVLEEPGGQRPVAAARRDRAFAEQHLIVPGDQATGDDTGILIVDGRAVIADEAFPGIAFRYSDHYRLAAVAAVLHAESILVHPARLYRCAGPRWSVATG